MNLYKETYKLVSQIPKGKVSTYKQVAKALGDSKISRTVGQMLSDNKNLKEIPCYRVIKSDGSVGGYRGGKPEKIRKLEKDGFIIKDEKIINFDRHLFTNFSTTKPLETLRKKQSNLKKKVVTENDFDEIEIVGGFDASFKDRMQKSVGVTMQGNSLMTRVTDKRECHFPYIFSYLAFREMGGIKRCYEKMSIKPDLLFVNASGILHPRGLGMASHLGVLLNKPTIGITQNLPYGNLKRKYIYDKNKKKGYKLQRNEKKAIYISPGHKISLQKAIEYTKKYLKDNPLPDPLYNAHKFTVWE